jgi:hypothetical protein
MNRRQEAVMIGAGACALAAVFWLIIVLLGTGCATPAPAPNPTPSSNGIPNLCLMEPGVWRGGQPRSSNQWAYIVFVLYCTNIVKLDTAEQGDDSLAEIMGATVHRHPIDTLQQLVTGPNSNDLCQAVSEIGAGTYVHCEIGEDRTGLAGGMEDLKRGTNKAAAYRRMLEHGFHPALKGMQRFWDSLPEP